MYKTVECSPPGAAPAFRMPAARSHSWSMVVMIKQHLKQNVYEAFLERLKFIFEEFDNIYISFSGGKDSGLLLNLVLDYRDRCFPQKALGVFHQDFEAQYTVTTEYVERTFERIKGRVEPYWVCLPMATRTALSSYEMYWYPWDDTRRRRLGAGNAAKGIRRQPGKQPHDRPTAIACIRRTLPSSSADGTAFHTAAGKPSVCWASGRTNPCSGTAAF